MKKGSIPVYLLANAYSAIPATAGKNRRISARAYEELGEDFPRSSAS